eukprot:2360205-Amphidinium_carterae.1
MEAHARREQQVMILADFRCSIVHAQQVPLSVSHGQVSSVDESMLLGSLFGRSYMQGIAPRPMLVDIILAGGLHSDLILMFTLLTYLILPH